MKFMRVFIILLVVSLPVALLLADALKPTERVSVSVEGLDSNYRYREEHLQSAVVIISNAGPHVLSFDVALQKKERLWWDNPESIHEFVFDIGPSELQPFSQCVFHLPVPMTPIPHPWRVVVFCNRRSLDMDKFERQWLRVRSWIVNDYSFHYFFSSQEIPFNTVLKPVSQVLLSATNSSNGDF
jgi:hypothetical protein